MSATSPPRATELQGSAGSPIEARVHRGALARFTQLIFVRQVVQEMMRVVGRDLARRSVTGFRFDAIDLPAMMIHDPCQNNRLRFSQRPPSAHGVGRDTEILGEVALDDRPPLHPSIGAGSTARSVDSDASLASSKSLIVPVDIMIAPVPLPMTQRQASIVECRDQLQRVGLAFVVIDEESCLVRCDQLPDSLHRSD